MSWIIKILSGRRQHARRSAIGIFNIRHNDGTHKRRTKHKLRCVEAPGALLFDVYFVQLEFELFDVDDHAMTSQRSQAPPHAGSKDISLQLLSMRSRYENQLNET